MIGEWNNGTGRRKSSVARVFHQKRHRQDRRSTAKTSKAFFGRETSIMICQAAART